MNKKEAAYIGRWRIVEMEQWHQHFVDAESPGHITFKKKRLGELHFGCVNVDLDWRYDSSMDRVDFTFEGSDECSPTFGRGWARLEGKQLTGVLAFHGGDESGFTAKLSR